MISISLEVTQETAITVSQKNEVLVTTAEGCDPHPAKGTVVGIHQISHRVIGST